MVSGACDGHCCQRWLRTWSWNAVQGKSLQKLRRCDVEHNRKRCIHRICKQYSNDSSPLFLFPLLPRSSSRLPSLPPVRPSVPCSFHAPSPPTCHVLQGYKTHVAHVLYIERKWRMRTCITWRHVYVRLHVLQESIYCTNYPVPISANRPALSNPPSEAWSPIILSHEWKIVPSLNLWSKAILLPEPQLEESFPYP